MLLLRWSWWRRWRHGCRGNNRLRQLGRRAVSRHHRQTTVFFYHRVWQTTPATSDTLVHEPAFDTKSFPAPVMWSETAGLSTRPVWDQKIGLGLARCSLGLGLAGLVLSCETRSYRARRHNDLKDTATFQVLLIVSLLCAWNINTVEINSGVHLLKR